MRKIISAFIVAIVLAVMCSATAVPAQAQTAGERFGIGMFTYQNNTFVGLAMRYPTEPQEIGGVVVELAAAAEAANQTGIPNDVMSIVEQWETVGPKVKQTVAHVGPMIDNNRPAYVHDYEAVDVLAPLVPRLAMYGFGSWGVPSYRLYNARGEDELAVWGQDRLWLVAATIKRLLQTP